MQFQLWIKTKVKVLVKELQKLWMRNLLMTTHNIKKNRTKVKNKIKKLHNQKNYPKLMRTLL